MSPESQFVLSKNRSFFPEYYREEEIMFIIQMIIKKQSGMVIGGSGVGKSNIVRILADMPAYILKLLPNEGKYLFCFVDVNSISKENPTFFYRSMLYELREAAENVDLPIYSDLRQLDIDTIQLNDEQSWIFALRDAHKLVIQQAGLHVVWLLDRFDEACAFVDDSALDTLRSLRDRRLFKGKLFYLGFSRKPLTRLRDWRKSSEFLEIMESNTCWVGPMDERDARWNVQQIAQSQNTEISSGIEAAIVKQTGGLPAFTKAASELWLKESEAIQKAASQRDTGSSKIMELIGAELQIRLLQADTIPRTCGEILDDLEENERQTLKYIASGLQQISLDPDAISYLVNHGLIKQHEYIGETKDVEQKWIIFSPLFEAYIRGVGDREITVDYGRRQLLLDNIPMETGLTGNPYELASFMVKRPNEALTDDEIGELLWPNDPRDGPDHKQDIDAALAKVRRDLKAFSKAHNIKPSLHLRFFTKDKHRFYKPNPK